MTDNIEYKQISDDELYKEILSFIDTHEVFDILDICTIINADPIQIKRVCEKIVDDELVKYE